jgi:uroporphyrin-3 C-methyltransferase
MTDQQLSNDQSRHDGFKWARIGLFISTLAFVIFILSFGYGFYALTNNNITLSQVISELQKKVTETERNVSDMQQSLSGIQQSLEKSQAVATQQEEVIAEWRAAQKGDVDKWHVAEAQYLVKLANDTMQYSHNAPMALALLKRANQILEKLSDPNLLDIRKSLASDETNLQATQEINVTDLYLRLTALNEQLDKLSLSISPLKANEQSTTTIATSSPSPELSWWRAGLERSWQALSKVVIVRYNGSNALPLVLPEEKIFLYQNMHAQMESAMWAVLHRNASVYQASLTRLISWIEKYFSPDATETKVLLQNLHDLQKINLEPPAINFSNTMQLHDNYVAAAQPAKATQ